MSLSRRRLLVAAGAAIAARAFDARAFDFSRVALTADGVVRNGRLKQSVSRWPYQPIPFPDFCRAVADIGLTAIDLLEEADWAVARQHGLICSMGYAGGGSIPDGLNVKANHDAIERNFVRLVPQAAAQQVPNVITFFGSRRGMADREAIDNCVAGLNRVKKIAEDNGVTICVELLNSKVNHKDYQGDHTGFGVEVMKAVDSPRVKLLYDIYHMQIMEGDIARTAQKHLARIAHVQLADNPGRNEPGTGEINYPFLFRHLDAIGYRGWVGCEYKPRTTTVDGLGWHAAQIFET
jgi:hydroxypyruvate isomerase